MRIRSMLLSTVLCGGVLALFVSPAGSANAMPMVNPQGTWAVTKVDAKKTGATPYCALSRRFGNGSILTFARNAYDETSLAVDFPPNSFKAGQDYTVMLDPGSGETRSYKARPVSERGMVIRMGRDEKFYDALERAEKLSINVDDQGFAFSMMDIKAGTQDLAACLGTAVEPAAGGDAPAPAIAASANMNNEVQAVKEENMRLRAALERERKAYEDKMQSGSDTSATAELTEKLQILQKENAALKSQVVGAGKLPPGTVVPAPALAAATPSCAPAKQDDEAVNLLRAENSKLKSELDAQMQRIALSPVSADVKMLDSLRAENAQLKSDIDAQKQKIASLELSQKGASGDAAAQAALSAQLADMKQQMAKLQSENQSLKSIVESRQATAAAPEDMKANVAAIARMKSMEEQMVQLRADKDRMADKIAMLSKSAAPANIPGGPNVRISSDNWNLEQATERYNQAENEIRRLGSVIEQERAKCSIEKKNIEYMLFDPKIAAKEQIAKMVTLENELAQAKQASNGSAEDKAKIAMADKNIADLKSQLAATTDQVAQLQKSLSEARNTKVASADQSPVVDALRQEVASLNNQIANMQNEKIASAESLAAIHPAAGGNDVSASRLSARPETIVPKPAIEVDTEIFSQQVDGKPLSIVPPSVVSKPLPATMAAAPVPAIASGVQASNAKLMTKADVGTLLQKAGVNLSSDVQAVAGATGSGHVTYRWETNGLFGTIEQKAIENPAQYDRYVQDYLDKTKSRCQGEFAAVPGLMNGSDDARVSSYEIACVDEKSGDGASAALAFYSQNGTFTSVAHETSSESMDVAMDVRDRIATVIGDSKTASR